MEGVKLRTCEVVFPGPGPPLESGHMYNNKNNGNFNTQHLTGTVTMARVAINKSMIRKQSS